VIVRDTGRFRIATRFGRVCALFLAAGVLGAQAADGDTTPTHGVLVFGAVMSYGGEDSNTYVAGFTDRPDGRELRRITPWQALSQRTRLGADWPRLSPDGTRIAWATELGILITDPNGVRRQVIKTGVIVGDVAWSPDGIELAYTSWPGRWIKIVAATGGHRRRINTRVLPSNLSWSPDGQTIAFLGTRAVGYDIYRIGIDGRGLRQLTHAVGLVGGPEWSPDGRLIAYPVSTDDQGRGGPPGLWLASVDGSKKHLIRRANLRFDDCCAWSPDGTSIAFNPDDTRTIVFVSPAGKKLATLQINQPMRARRHAWRRLDYIDGIDWR
jgi:dipeptidyl aminopeptidase/acylaminoacyl peptidase